MKSRAQPWLGTRVEMSIQDDLPWRDLLAAYQSGFDAVRQVHQLMSFHDADSDVGRFNRALPQTVIKVDPHTFYVLQVAEDLYQRSSGLFNIAVANRLIEWDYLPAQGAMALPLWQPSRQAYRLVAPDQVEKLSDARIDLGGIAKGYAVDQAILNLKNCGVQRALVNAGGDLRVIGDEPTPISLRDPTHPQRSAKKLNLNNMALATSGSYFSEKSHNDERVSALVNALSGEPIVSSSSFSVLAEECIHADALTKVLAASGNPDHPCFQFYSAQALIG
ncbi:thiamine biosynthesis lipoprotein [Oxalobacteraceae bacterium GrIS 2.11]